MQALKGVRVSNGCTQEDAAKLIGVTRVHYSNKENQKVPFSLAEIEILRKAWRMTDHDIVRCFFAH